MRKSLAKIESLLFYSIILLISTQLGKHFWPDFAYIQGIRVDYLSPTIFLTDILVGLLFILWLINKNSKSEYRNPKQHQNTKNKKPKRFEHLSFANSNLFRASNFVPLILIPYLLVNIYLSGRIAGGLYSLLKLFEMGFISYYSAKFIINKNVFQKAVIFLSIGGIFQSILAIAQFVNQGSIGGLLYFLGERAFMSSTPGIANASLNGELVLRPYGTLPHPNVLAGYLLIVLAIALFTFKRSESTKIKVLKSSVLVICSIALFLSMSRVAILLWIIIAAWFWISRLIPPLGTDEEVRLYGRVEHNVSWFLRWRRDKIKVGAVLMFISAVISIFMLSPIGSRFSGINFADEAVVQRAILIDSSIKMIGQRPLLGVGLGNFLPTLATVQKPLSTFTYLQPVHNIFLLVAAETGLIGLSVFLWFLWKTFERIKNQESRIKRPLLIVLSVILITGFLDHYWLTLQQGQLLFAFVIGLCLSKLLNSKRM